MERLIYSERLLKKLEALRQARIAVLEAPAGYGKTTAVSRALEGAATAVWYTGVEHLPDTSFYWFIRQLSAVDERAVRRIEALGFLNRSNAEQVARALMELRVEKPLTLIFDNFQLAADNWPPQVIDALAKRPADGLHLIFIAQNLGALRPVFDGLERSVCFLRASDLLLTREDILAFSARRGEALTEAQADAIMASTGGWPAAAALCVEAGGVTGEMDELLYRLFWARMEARQRTALLYLSLFDCVTPSMLDALLPAGVLPPEERDDFFRRVPLVRQDALRGRYYPHELLLRFLRARLDEADEETRRRIYGRAGQWYRDNDATRAAVDCFFRAGDDEGILSCRLVGLITERFGDVSYTELAAAVLRRCPEEVQRRYPLSLLRLCYALYGGCDFGEFARQMARVRGLLREKQHLGEWELLDALEFFPDLDRMDAAYARAEALMTRPSELFIPEEPFFFGCASMWYLFYAEPGQMMATAERMAVVFKRYDRLTNGHAAGAAELYRGEAYSVQGRFEEADIQAYQAAFLSEQSRSATVTYGAALLLGINAIYHSDMAGLQKAVDYLENKARSYAFLQGMSLGTYMAETVRGYLLGLMMETSRSPLWARGGADTLSDLTFTNFMIKTCRVTDLLLKKEYQRAIASVEASLALDSRLISAATRNFMYCGLALCYLATGRLGRAAEWLDRSLSMAERDKNYSFIACFRKYFQPLFLMPSIATRHGQAIREIKALGIHYTRADESRIFAMLDDVPELKESLTDREREVAELAARGMRNSEIAETLHISENTVKHHLKNAFQKMNIDRRSHLIEMLR